MLFKADERDICVTFEIVMPGRLVRNLAGDLRQPCAGRHGIQVLPCFHRRFTAIGFLPLLCEGEKRQNSSRVKCWVTSLAILAVLSVSLGEDFKTIRGKVYKDATITRVEPDGIVLRTKTGISKVYFVELPKDVQERFHPSPVKTPAAPLEREPVKSNDQVGMTANPIRLIMFFAAGLIIVLVVVFAVILRGFR
jgi:hypothetical protein